MQFQTDINMRFADGSPVPNLGGPMEQKIPEDSAQKAINYRTEPLWKRMGYRAGDSVSKHEHLRLHQRADQRTGGRRSTNPGVHGKAGQAGQVQNSECQRAHAQQRVQPARTLLAGRAYTNNSKSIGNNPLSEFKGAQYGIGPSSHYEVIPVNGAGGGPALPVTTCIALSIPSCSMEESGASSSVQGAVATWSNDQESRIVRKYCTDH